MVNFNDIVQFNKNNNSERLFNLSFNKNGINSPKTSFLSIEKINQFCFNNNNISYENYFKFLSNEFGINFDKYLDNLTNIWKQRDLNIDKDKAKKYLYKKFIIDPINGALLEHKAKTIIKNSLPECSFFEPTPLQDINECWDIKIASKNNSFSIQIKPESFFYGFKTTTKKSFLKIMNANNKYNNNIFFAGFFKNELYILIRDKSNLKPYKLIHHSYLPKMADLSQNQINKLSKITFNNILNSITTNNNTTKRLKK